MYTIYVRRAFSSRRTFRRLRPSAPRLINADPPRRRNGDVDEARGGWNVSSRFFPLSHSPLRSRTSRLSVNLYNGFNLRAARCAGSTRPPGFGRVIIATRRRVQDRSAHKCIQGVFEVFFFFLFFARLAFGFALCKTRTHRSLTILSFCIRAERYS